MEQSIIKVFALYLGCEIQTPDDSITKYWYIKSDLIAYQVSGSPHISHKYANDCKLILRPLEANEFSPEELESLYDIIKVKPEYRTPETLIKNLTGFYVSEPHKLISAADYLRSRGFDLPTFYLDGKRPSECGIAILNPSPQQVVGSI